MKQRTGFFFKRVRGWYYYQELRELSTIGCMFLLGWLMYRYGESIIEFTSTERGLLYCLSFLLSIVLGLTLKLYYRIVVIKYHEKDVKIKLFENTVTSKECL